MSFIDIGHYHRTKQGQLVPGDHVIIHRDRLRDRRVCILADGLGSGIKANVMASMTATMAIRFILNDRDIRQTAETIMRSLPVCQSRRVGYSTFTILDIGRDRTTTVVEFDNPPSFVVRGQALLVPDRSEVELETFVGEVPVILKQYQIQLQTGDRLVVCTDGISQAGIGTVATPAGMGHEGLRQVCQRFIQQEPTISSRELSRKMVMQAIQHDGGKPKDDLTCCVVHMRQPRRTLVVSGPPLSPGRDSELAERISSFKGKRVICGGTTAEILARELAIPVKVSSEDLSQGIPPASQMAGMDLVTEGIITLGYAYELLETGAEIANEGNAAHALAHELLDSDHITFIVGTRINEAHHAPDTTKNLDIRRNIIRKLADLLEAHYHKDTVVHLM